MVAGLFFLFASTAYGNAAVVKRKGFFSELARDEWLEFSNNALKSIFSWTVEFGVEGEPKQVSF